MTKYHKTDIFLVCEGMTEEATIISPHVGEFWSADCWYSDKPYINQKAEKKLSIVKKIGNIIEIANILAISSHMGIAEKKLEQHIKKHGFDKPFEHFIIKESMLMPYDVTMVKVRRNYKAKKTQLFDFVYNKPFNARRYIR